jgi:hypothetical protein
MRLTSKLLPRPGHIIRQVIEATFPPPAEVPAAASADDGAKGAADPAPAVRQQSSSQSLPPPSRSNSALPPPSRSNSALTPDGASQPMYGSLLDKEAARVAKFERILSVEIVDLAALRDASWSGIPAQYRMAAWQHLLGYLPVNGEWRASTLQRKRREYAEAVPQFFDVDDSERSEYQRAIFHQVRRARSLGTRGASSGPARPLAARSLAAAPLPYPCAQILLDVPRTCSASALFQHKAVQRSLERILYIWALRHPASGYVQVPLASRSCAH